MLTMVDIGSSIILIGIIIVTDHKLKVTDIRGSNTLRPKRKCGLCGFLRDPSHHLVQLWVHLWTLGMQEKTILTQWTQLKLGTELKFELLL